MTTADISPKVHTFNKLDKLSDKQILMIVLPSGEKFQATVGEFKQFIMEEIKIPKPKEITREDIMKLISGQPFSILANYSIEKLELPGVIYSDGNRTRVFQGGKWVTLKVEEDV